MWQYFCSCRATDSSAHATTDAAGSRRAISLARLGPVMTAIRSGPAPVTSAMTSLMRRCDPSSTPFMRLTITADGSIRSPHAPRLVRSVCDGTASTTISAPASASAGSVVARIVSGSSRSGRYSVFSCRWLTLSHVS